MDRLLTLYLETQLYRTLGNTAKNASFIRSRRYVNHKPRFSSLDAVIQDLPMMDPESDSFSDEDKELSEESDEEVYNTNRMPSASPAPTNYFPWSSSPVKPLPEDDDDDDDDSSPSEQQYSSAQEEQEDSEGNEDVTNPIPMAQPKVFPLSTPFTFGFSVTTAGSGEQVPATNASSNSETDMSTALRRAADNLPSGWLDTSGEQSIARVIKSEPKGESQESDYTVSTIEITPSNQISLSGEVPAAQRASKVLVTQSDEESTSESEAELGDEYYGAPPSQLSELGASSSDSESEDGSSAERGPSAHQIKKEPSSQGIPAPSREGIVSKSAAIPVSEAPKPKPPKQPSKESSTAPAQKPGTVQQTESIKSKPSHSHSRNDNDASTWPQKEPPANHTTPLPPEDARSISKPAAPSKHLTSIKHTTTGLSTRSTTTTTVLGKRRTTEDAGDQEPEPASKRVKPTFSEDDENKAGSLTRAEKRGVVTVTARPTAVIGGFAEAATRVQPRTGALITAAGPAAPKSDSRGPSKYHAIGFPHNGVRPAWNIEQKGSASRNLFESFLAKTGRLQRSVSAQSSSTSVQTHSRSASGTSS
jgi:hypothetical protein